MESPPDAPQPDRLEPPPEIVARAAEWLAHLESGDADDGDRAAFDTWRSLHPAHALAIDRLGGLDARLNDGTEVERETLRRLFLRPRRRGRAVLTGLVVLIGAGWFTLTRPAVRLYLADERTPIGKTRAVPLPDGSRIVLASDSAADLDMTSRRRSVKLLRGEVLAQVAKGRDVPFVVETMDGTAEAMGTAFTVRREAAGTVIVVISSHVRACPARMPVDRCLTLGPGESARVAQGRAWRLADVPPGDAGAWAEGWLPVEDRPLVEVLDALNRWRPTALRFDRDALADLRVSGVFPLGDTDRAIDNLARSEPIAVDRSDPAAPVIRRLPR